MHLTPSEVKYLRDILKQTSNFAIAKGEQIDHPTINHERLQRKMDDYLVRMKC